MNSAKIDYEQWQQEELMIAQLKSVSCKNRNKHCEGHDLPCDVCTTYEPIRRRRDS